MKSLTVFCGSSMGNQEIYQNQAYLLGQILASKQIQLVYGGAKVGLMGAVADAVLQHHGKVIGVLPTFLASKEIAHQGLNEMKLVETMHERKTTMNELCDGVIALPGGFGTMEELFEMLTWAQLGLHQKPIGLLNVEGYYDDLIGFIQKMVDKGFLCPLNQSMLLVSDNASDLIEKMMNYKAPIVPKWIHAGEE